MTRGILAIIVNDTVYYSTEFNGDMYPEGNGQLAIKALQDIQVSSVRNISRMFAYVNREGGYNYPEGGEVYTVPLSQIAEAIHLTDYTYIKNMDSEDMLIRTSEGEFVVSPWQIAVFNFQEFVEIIDGSGEENVELKHENGKGQELRFCTDINRNGNSTTLLVDVARKQFQYGNFVFIPNRADDIVLSRKELRKLADHLRRLNFKEV